MLVCDGVLPACLQASQQVVGDLGKFAEEGPQGTICRGCTRASDRMQLESPLVWHKMGDYISESDRVNAKEFANNHGELLPQNLSVDGVELDFEIRAGVGRFFARLSQPEGEHAGVIVKRYIEAAYLSVCAVRRLCSENDYDGAFFNHGVFVPHGVIRQVLRKMGMRFLNWSLGTHPSTLIISNGDFHHYDLGREPEDRWVPPAWDDSKRQIISEFLKERRSWVEKGGMTAPWTTSGVSKYLFDKYGIDVTSKPTFVAITNLVWEAESPNRHAFTNQFHWISSTIEYFSRRDDLQLVIRVHPCEVTGTQPTLERVANFIEKNYPNLPQNIKVIAPDDLISTYAMMEFASAYIAYISTMAAEISAAGVPVIVAGFAPSRGKGFTYDPVSVQDYGAYIDMLSDKKPLSNDRVDLALKFAYNFFYRNHLPFGNVTYDGVIGGYKNYKSYEDLLEGGCSGLDAICDSLISSRLIQRSIDEYVKWDGFKMA